MSLFTQAPPSDKNKVEKRLREDKEKVMDILFNAFEKHQYYNVKDLVTITKQPIVSYVNYVLTNQLLPLQLDWSSCLCCLDWPQHKKNRIACDKHLYLINEWFSIHTIYMNLFIWFEHILYCSYILQWVAQVLKLM